MQHMAYNFPIIDPIPHHCHICTGHVVAITTPRDKFLSSYWLGRYRNTNVLHKGTEGGRVEST